VTPSGIKPTTIQLVAQCPLFGKYISHFFQNTKVHKNYAWRVANNQVCRMMRNEEDEGEEK
jgi:hypothetical protein